MLARVEPAEAQASPMLDALRPTIDLHRQIALFRRRLRLFLAIAALVFLSVVLITLQLTPRYTAVATVMLDTRKHQVVDTQAVLSGLPSDAAQVDTEVEILKSRALAEKVVAQLKLDQDPEFNPDLRKTSPLSKVAAMFGGREASPAVKHAKLIDEVVKRLKVTRQGVTYVMNVAFESEDPKKAALIANTFAERYLTEQLDAKFDATQRANKWLNDRLAGLRQEVIASEAAVAQFKAANGLVGLQSSEGATIAQQEVSTLNTQLAAARAQQAEAEAKLSTARSQLARGSTGEDLGETLSSATIIDLRKQRTELAAQVADMQGRYGPKYPELVAAQRKLAEIDAQIQAEIRRIISNLDAQAQVARQRTASIASSVAGSKSVLNSNTTAQVKLDELERVAESNKTLYQSFLDRFKQTSQEQGLEQSDARIVSPAKIPTLPSFPNIPLNLAIGIVLAMGAALGAVFLGEALESGLYTSEDVERELNMPYLGATPELASSIDRKKGDVRGIAPTDYVVEKPLSSFAEAFRNLKTSISASRVGEQVKLIAVTSSLPNEGKTTTAICLARVMAVGGAATLLVDCDLRRRTVNRLFREEPTFGLLEVLSGACTLDQAILRDPASGCYVLPLTKSSYTPRDVFSSEAMDRLLEEIRARFEIAILDTAPVLPVADTRVIAPKVDAVLFLAQWRRTPRKAVQNALRQLEVVGAFVAGVGLTQVDMREQARSGYGDASYYYRAYKSYYSVG